MSAMTRDEAMALWDQANPDPSDAELDHIEVFFDRVLLRGDEVLVYQDDEGAVKMISYGSHQSLIRRVNYPTHPLVLPDVPGENNYRFHLKGVVSDVRRETAS